MNKKIMAWTLSLVLIIVVVVLFYVHYGKSVNDKGIEGQNEKQTTSIPEGGLLSDQDQSFSRTSSWLNGAEVINVDAGNLNEKFFDFSQKERSELDWAVFYGSDGKQIDLEDFLSETGASIYPDLYSIVDKSDYAVFSCGEEDGIRTNGIYLNIKLMPEYVGNLYADEESFMKKWEPSMIKDLKRVVFPGIDFSATDPSQQAIFSDGEYRYATIDLPNGKKGSINYALVDDYVLISNSKKCLSDGINELYGPDSEP